MAAWGSSLHRARKWQENLNSFQVVGSALGKCQFVDHCSSRMPFGNLRALLPEPGAPHGKGSSDTAPCLFSLFHSCQLSATTCTVYLAPLCLGLPSQNTRVGYRFPLRSSQLQDGIPISCDGRQVITLLQVRTPSCF